MSEPRPGVRLAIATVFLAHGLVYASWVPRIPQLQAALQLDAAGVGVALLGAPVGAVAAMMTAGALIPRWGARAVIAAAMAVYGLAGAGLGLVGSLPQLFLVLALWGAGQGGLDVAMNTQAVAIQHHLGHPIMSRLHAGWSVGALAGTLLGIGAQAAGIPLGVQLLGLGLACLAAVLAVLGRLPGVGAPTGRMRRIARPSWRLLLLGAIAFLGLLAEGSADNWSAIYLRHTASAGASVAGLGYAAFAALMFLGRVVGDRATRRFGRAALVRFMAALAALGLAAACLFHQPSVVIAGFGLMGLGLSATVPAAFTAAGTLPGTPPGPGVAAVSSFGWAGFLVGPPLIGLIAQHSSLAWALGLVAAGCLAVSVLAPALASPAVTAQAPR